MAGLEVVRLVADASKPLTKRSSLPVDAASMDSDSKCGTPLSNVNIMALDVRRPDAPDVLADHFERLPGALGKQAEGAWHGCRWSPIFRPRRAVHDGLRRAGVDVAVRVGRFLVRPVFWW